VLPRCWFWLSSLLAVIVGSNLRAADLKEAQQQFISGDYSGCIATGQKALNSGEETEEWALLLTQALLTTGQYSEARTVITNALERHRRNIRLSWQAREVFLAHGQPERAKEMLDNIGWVVGGHPSDFSEASDLVISGKAALALGINW